MSYMYAIGLLLRHLIATRLSCESITLTRVMHCVQQIYDNDIDSIWSWGIDVRRCMHRHPYSAKYSVH